VSRGGYQAAALKSYGAKGQDVVDKNYAAIDRGGEYVQLTVKPEWANLPADEEKADNAPAFVKEVVRPINAQAGDLLKVSDFVKHGVLLIIFRNLSPRIMGSVLLITF
jgi:pyruvate-ferredoxin/flavodoxin oxidoreductase